MSLINSEFDSNHDGIVHCVKYDHYGKRIATGGSDGKINIFLIENSNKITLQAKLTKNGHQHSVWDLSWSHPKYGTYLASCSYDHKIIIWKETFSSNWEIVYTYDKHTGSVNKCEFAPYQYGLILLCCSSDGSLSLHEYKNDKSSWVSYQIPNAHMGEINSVSWGPAFPPIDFQEEDNGLSEEVMPMRFASGGSDGQMKIWSSFKNSITGFQSGDPKIQRDIAIRDVAWLNYVGYSYDTIAISFDNGPVVIYKVKSQGEEETKEIDIKKPGIKVSWSHCGTYLSICTGENEVHFYQENLDQTWDEVKTPEIELK